MKITDTIDTPPPKMHPDTPAWAAVLYDMVAQVYQRDVVSGRTLTAFEARLTLAEQAVLDLKGQIAELKRRDTLPAPPLEHEETTQPGV